VGLVKTRAVAQATREVFYPCSPIVGGTAAWVEKGYHAGVQIDASGEYAVIEGYVPWDFTTLVDFKMVFIANVTNVDMDFKQEICIAAKGEVYNQHSGSQSPAMPTTINTIHELSFVGLTGVINAGDYFGLRVSWRTNSNIVLLGVRLRYT